MRPRMPISKCVCPLVCWLVRWSVTHFLVSAQIRKNWLSITLLTSAIFLVQSFTLKLFFKLPFSILLFQLRKIQSLQDVGHNFVSLRTSYISLPYLDNAQSLDISSLI